MGGIRCSKFANTLSVKDFFTTEGSPIFRFERTVGSTRSAVSLDGNINKTYFSVEDKSWGCKSYISSYDLLQCFGTTSLLNEGNARWEVTIFHLKDKSEVKWQVFGDEQMRGLDITQEDEMLAIVQESGDHEVCIFIRSPL